jgi:predicted phosphodiesterase
MIALISDIHGNYPALLSVLNKIDEMGINEIYCLGDIVGYYTQVNECCEELQKRNVKCILGNHDWYMISKTNCPRSKSANDCLQYQSKILKVENLKWLESLPILLQIDDLSIVHAGWSNPLDEYLTDIDQSYFESISNRFFSSGHTHKQSIKLFGSKVYCNPGSVGQPRDGNCNAAFATFNGESFQLHRVEYDIELTCRLMNNAGFSEYYYNRLRVGAENFII